MDIKVYTRKEACKILKIGLSSLESLLKSGKLKSKKVGNKYLITSDHITEYLRG